MATGTEITVEGEVRSAHGEPGIGPSVRRDALPGCRGFHALPPTFHRLHRGEGNPSRFDVVAPDDVAGCRDASTTVSTVHRTALRTTPWY